MPKEPSNKVSKSQEDQTVFLFIAWMVFLLGAAFLGGLMWMFGFRRPQILEAWILTLLAYYLVVDTLKITWKRLRDRDKLWPKPKLLYSEKYDRKQLARAAAENSTLLGYEDNGKPVFWTDDQRRMQTNVPGQSGSGKSTLLYNVLEQDIRRGKAVVFLDGKGEKDFVIKLMAAAIAAGRADDIRLIDPTHPDKSHKYNPFYAPNGKMSERVGIVFDSLPASDAKDQFFAEYQGSFLSSLCNILSYTGRILTFQSVYAAAMQPNYVLETIQNLHDSVMNDPNLKPFAKEAFEADAVNLRTKYGDEKWQGLIQGLLNSIKPFISEELSEITNATENLVTLDEVVEKNLILLVTMNIPKDSTNTVILGKMILRDLQSVIASRYEPYKMNQKHSFVSVVLDEFGLFSYKDFSNIIHTARAANVAFIFSFQNVNQLAAHVGETFANDVSMATNCKFLMKISDQRTAEIFTSASAAVPTERVSYQVEKEVGITGYQETGRGTRTETFETRVKDHHVKQLPTGQMMALMHDARMGVIVKHVHVRRPTEYFIESAISDEENNPRWIKPYATSVAESNKLNIKFAVEETTRKGNNGRRARK
jgi:type IV secretory pathway TraG/TraD family ATPase VirD4